MADFSAFTDPSEDPQNYQPTPPYTPPPGPVTTTAPLQINGPIAPFGAPPPKGPGAGGSGVTGGGDFGPQFDFSAFPRFNPKNREFTPLTLEQAQNEPGYKFAETQGQQGIERSAAAKGVLRTGGTLKDIGSWINDFATRNYADANQRELQRFSTNYGIEKDMFAPILSEAQSRFGAEVQRGLAAYNRGTQWNAPHAGGGGGAPATLSYEEWKRQNGYA